MHIYICLLSTDTVLCLHVCIYVLIYNYNSFYNMYRKNEKEQFFMVALQTHKQMLFMERKSKKNILKYYNFCLGLTGFPFSIACVYPHAYACMHS